MYKQAILNTTQGFPLPSLQIHLTSKITDLTFAKLSRFTCALCDCVLVFLCKIFEGSSKGSINDFVFLPHVYLYWPI